MHSVYKNFYRSFYLRTGGFLPTAPLNISVFPGDFFQIKNGELLLLGNIFRNKLVDDSYVRFGYGHKLNPGSWNFSDGITKPYSGRGSGHSPLKGEFEFSKQVLAFAHKGSFLFKGNEPESVKIANWSEIEQQLIIKLTTTMYSFREVYVVTECATTADWTLAIAGADKAELEIASDSESAGLIEIFGHQSSKTIQSKEIEYYHREPKRNPNFFKAKRLVVQPESLEVFISDLIERHYNQNIWATEYFDYSFECDSVYTPNLRKNNEAGLLDMLQVNQLNPNTALLYFNWADADTNDIEKLFLTYGE